MRLRNALSGLLVLSMTTACATIQRGPVQKVYIESDPAGAAVELEKCGRQPKDLRTPTDLFISRRVKRCTVLVTLDGYEPARVMLQRRPADDDGLTSDDVIDMCGTYGENCNSLSDLLIMGTIGVAFWGVGLGVDAVAGANYELEPRHVRVELQPVERPTASIEP